MRQGRGQPIGTQTYRITISEGEIVDRRRVDADDNCLTENYEPLERIGGRDEACDEGKPSGKFIVLKRRQQPRRDAADTGDTTGQRHQRDCGKADQRATDERCERRLLQSGVVRLTSAGTGRTVNCPLILPLKLNTRANRIFQPFS